jgi:thymidylate kinase
MIMKKLIFLCGPNGIGKTTICKEIMNQLPNSAYVDSDPCRMMNPFVLDDQTIPTISKNISDLILNYLHCPIVDIVIFSYGFHGRRYEVFQSVLNHISGTQFSFIPFLLWCSEEENKKRMNNDKRSPDRIKRTIDESRKAYNEIAYSKIDITHLSVIEAAKEIISKLDSPA